MMAGPKRQVAKKNHIKKVSIQNSESRFLPASRLMSLAFDTVRMLDRHATIVTGHDTFVSTLFDGWQERSSNFFPCFLPAFQLWPGVGCVRDGGSMFFRKNWGTRRKKRAKNPLFSGFCVPLHSWDSGGTRWAKRDRRNEKVCRQHWYNWYKLNKMIDLFGNVSRPDLGPLFQFNVGQGSTQRPET